MNWIMVLIILLIGCAVGALLSLIIAHRGGRRSAEDERIRLEYANYRSHVADHFVKTAGLVNEMTESYKKVFDHLHESAQTLMDEETRAERLQQVEGEPITLSRLGYSVSQKEPAEKAVDVDTRSREEFRERFRERHVAASQADMPKTSTNGAGPRTSAEPARQPEPRPERAATTHSPLQRSVQANPQARVSRPVDARSPDEIEARRAARADARSAQSKTEKPEPAAPSDRATRSPAAPLGQEQSHPQATGQPQGQPDREASPATRSRPAGPSPQPDRAANRSGNQPEAEDR